MTINNHNTIFLLKTGNATQCHAASQRACLPKTLRQHPSKTNAENSNG
jgi:hypothetical protein